jgi:hypothetical protein
LAWEAAPPLPDAIAVLSAQLHMELIEVKNEVQCTEERRVSAEGQIWHHINESMRLQEEKRARTELQLRQTISETTRILEEKIMQNQVLTQNLMTIREDLATRITSPGGGNGDGTGMSPMQEKKFEKMLETHVSGWELRTTTFLEKWLKVTSRNLRRS